MMACVSIIGNLSSNSLSTPRLTYAFAEQGDFPALFGKLHRFHRTPVVSIVFFTIVSAFLAISGTFVWLVTVSVVARLVSYLTTCLAVPFLRRRYAEESSFRIPLGPVIPAMGVLLCAWLIIHADARDIRAFALASVAGALLYLGRPRRVLAKVESDR